ncbi:MAG: TetR family transcriptional regulator [Armatimonadetes bacterium RBG_16_67_12]|nr:MAG: TetR family transcriptional regulator [Armatimonadetes bacterium RBG_16_67_12]
MIHLPGNRRPVTHPKGERGRRTRQQLLDAAEAAFGQRGYFATSVADITRRARVAQGTFYVYFPSKQAIFAELVRHLNRQLRHTIQEAVHGLDDRLAVERKGFEAFLRFVATHRDLYRIVMQAESVDPASYRWYYRHFAEGYVRGLRAAMDAGQIRRLDPEALAYCLMGIGNFVGLRYVLWDRARVPRRVLDSLFDFIAQGLVAVPPTGE